MKPNHTLYSSRSETYINTLSDTQNNQHPSIAQCPTDEPMSYKTQNNQHTTHAPQNNTDIHHDKTSDNNTYKYPTTSRETTRFNQLHKNNHITLLIKRNFPF